MEFYEIYAEVALAWVAFAGIVATLRLTFGGGFNEHQYVLFRYFTECSFILFGIALIVIALLTSDLDQGTVWKTMSIYVFLTIALYVPYHLRRRNRLKVNLPIISKLTALGYAVFGCVLLLAIFEVGLSPSSELIKAILLFGIFTNTLIFLNFLGTFVEIKRK